MSNKITRDRKEMKNLFEDPKFARKAWRAVGGAILSRPCVKPIQNFDKDGNETFDSLITNYSYRSLKEDIKQLGDTENTEPTELEMIMTCQALKARVDTGAAQFIRDTSGAKPVDESKVDANVKNPYESLTDEELELIVAHREAKAKEQESGKNEE